ncbi:hypothetical protein Bca52824_023359 [Brassica carinata]|uniref:Uncharacterized protein n=1 Tax=Brassica carinata TaxID=52824 RepID=A0A8X8AVK1_BRACI|nr:hypothetical protein Bca52824_023359 [Brassica carinata]
MGGRNRKSLRSFVSSSPEPPRERAPEVFLQAQVDLVPRQERLEFLYDSGLAVGKGSVSGSGVSFQKEELVKDFNVEIAPDFAQRAWMLKYPSAITSFGHIAAQAKDKKIAVFLDYDGTLVDV